jgi:hypothetical protein
MKLHHVILLFQIQQIPIIDLKTPGKPCSYPMKAFEYVKNWVLYCRTHHILCNKAYIKTCLFNIIPSHLQNSLFGGENSNMSASNFYYYKLFTLFPNELEII